MKLAGRNITPSVSGPRKKNTGDYDEKMRKDAGDQNSNAEAVGQLDAIVIRQSPLGGWKSSAAISAVSFLYALVSGLTGDIDICVAFIMSSFGWCGWAIQEWQHLNGYVIKDV